jgi:hypothetical protein
VPAFGSGHCSGRSRLISPKFPRFWPPFSL